MIRTEILAELMKLDTGERLQIVEMLWDSLDKGVPQLSDEQANEIGRRIAEHDFDPSSSIPWETVRARLWSQFE
jgi:putative addiction module component (TIGR02574 family)